MIRKILGLAVIGAIAALVASVPAYGKPVPAYGKPASQSSHLVQIGGRLVPPSQLSWFESHAGRVDSRSSHLVQIGGRLAPPSQLSAVEHQLSAGSLTSRTSTGSNASHVGRDVAIGVVGLFAVMLVAMGVTVPRHRHSFTPA
jgi:hypothetical protein